VNRTHRIALVVNDVAATRDVEARATLLDLLTELEGIGDGVGSGCRTNACGSCTVLLNGRSVRSCSILAVQASGSSVVTLGSSGQAIRDAVDEADRDRRFQCGYCAAGFLLNDIDAKAEGTAAGDVCRCTGYRFLREPRADIRSKTSARGRHGVGPTSRPTPSRDVWEAMFVRSDVAHGILREIDLDESRKVDGVAHILTSADLPPRLTDISVGEPVEGVSQPRLSALACGKVNMVGEPLAMVLADTRPAAEDAVWKAHVTYHPLTPVLEPSTTEPRIHADVADNLAVRRTGSSSRQPAVPENETRVVRRTYRSDRVAPSPMECRFGRARWDEEHDLLTYETATQAPEDARQVLARLLDLPRESVRVVVTEFGGSFGSKHCVQREDLLVCWAALKTGRTVQWKEDRAENIQASGHGRGEEIELAATVSNSGRITDLRANLKLDLGAYSTLPTHNAHLGLPIGVWIPAPYEIDNYAFEYTASYTNKAPYLTYRAPAAIAVWAREAFLDAVAKELGMDPIQFRLRNIAEDQHAVLDLPFGIRARGFRSARMLRKLAELVSRHPSPNPEPGCLHGMGFAVAAYAAPGNTDMVDGDVRPSEPASISLRNDGTVVVETAQVPHGQNHVEILTAVVADELGVPADRVTVLFGDTGTLSVESRGTFGSGFATFGVGAVRNAARALRALREAGSTERSVTVEYDGAPGGFSEMIHCCWVQVSTRTGRVFISRYLVLCDVGRILDDETVRGQIWGSIAQGLGQAGCESIRYDATGRPTVRTMSDYRFIAQSDLPPIEIVYTGRSDEGEGQSFGVGEIGCMAAPAALVNALADATGRDFCKLPIETVAVVKS
jgi:carbon-monoxide dehydrogenase large subunit